jgi:hypothetical protein
MYPGYSQSMGNIFTIHFLRKYLNIFNSKIMIRSFIITLLLFPTFLFSQDTLSSHLNHFLDAWHADAAQADMKAYFDKIDEEGVYIGTDATEYWTKAEFYEWSKPYFDRGKAWTFKALHRNIYFSPDSTIAWFDESIQSSSAVLRGSGVLQLRDGE